MRMMRNQKKKWNTTRAVSMAADFDFRLAQLFENSPNFKIKNSTKYWLISTKTEGADISLKTLSKRPTKR